MPKGPGRQHDLSPVMCFVGDEIAEDVPDVQRKIAPPIGPGRRDIPTVITAELQEMGDPVPAASQGGQELPGCDPPPINRGWHGLAVGRAEGPDPHAPRVVNVAGDHADRAARCPWQGGDPEVGRQLLHEIEREPTSGLPGGQDGLAQVGWGRHRGPLFHDGTRAERMAHPLRGRSRQPPRDLAFSIRRDGSRRKRAHCQPPALDRPCSPECLFRRGGWCLKADNT